MRLPDCDQPNVLDGGPLIVDIRDGCAFVTVAGMDDRPWILACDADDLTEWARVYSDVTGRKETP